VYQCRFSRTRFTLRDRGKTVRQPAHLNLNATWLFAHSVPVWFTRTRFTLRDGGKTVRQVVHFNLNAAVCS
jgi:hypothetical protein